MTALVLALIAITLEPFKFGGVRYSVGDPAPGLDELIAAGLVGIPGEKIDENEIDGTDETGGADIIPGDDSDEGTVTAETEIDETEIGNRENEIGNREAGTDAQFKAEHRGSGRWYVIDTATGASVSDSLTKVHAVMQADEMNAAAAPAGE